MKLNKLLHIIIPAILPLSAIFCPIKAAAQQHDNPPKWEQTDNLPPAGQTDIARSPDTQANVSVRDMYIYVELEQPTPVKLFTILGQPVSQMMLPSGTSRFRVSARGIYILKIGSATRRITI